MPLFTTDISTGAVSVHGSFVIGAICSEGAVMAAETRANIFDTTDPERKPLAYYDNMPKLFPVGPYAIAETGQGLILNVFFSAVVKEFDSRTRVRRLSELLPIFLEYCRATMPPATYGEMRKQKLLAGGYQEGQPLICYFDENQPGGPFGCMRAGFVESDVSSFACLRTTLGSLSAEQTAGLSEKAITEYASSGDRWKTIGGPVSVLHIAPGKMRWLRSQPQYPRWKYVQELIQDYREGRLTINLIPPATGEQLEKLLASVPPLRC